MFKLRDDFKTCDANKQPYSFSVERHTETANLHAEVKGDCFYLNSIGNRFVLNTPAFLCGTYQMDFRITYMVEIPFKFSVYFRYDEKSRKGTGIRFVYDLKDKLAITLVEVENSRIIVVDEVQVSVEHPLEETYFYSFVMDIGEKEVKGCIAGIEYSFPCEGTKGRLALERADFIGEFIIQYVDFVSEDIFEEECVIPETIVNIPNVNGGDIPYTVGWKIDRIEGEYYLTAKLDGGTRTRAVHREDRMGQYAVEKDWMTSPYIGLRNEESGRVVYNLAMGEKCFIDPNIYWECQKGFFGDTRLPIVNTYQLPGYMVSEDMEILFGYENLWCTGYGAQSGGCEFTYALDGKLLYYGQVVDGKDIFEVKSQKDKMAISFIPEDCYEREAVIQHIEDNHYFDVSEDMEFTLEIKTVVDPEYFTLKAAVLNVYETEVLGTYMPEIKIGHWEYDYHLITAVVNIPRMDIGVRKIEFSVYYGDKLYERIVKTFEVYDKDSDVNPALASGLPFVFSMPNEQKWLMRNSFDLWSPVKSCNLEHYITCITDTPLEAEIRQPWKIIKAFKREWFAWVASRTCNNWQMQNHLDVVKNADYLFCSVDEKVMDLSQSGLYPVRQDHFAYDNFMMRKETRMKLLDSFLQEYPEYAGRVEYKPGTEEFTFDHFVNLMQICGAEWMKYQNKKGILMLREQNEEIKKLNSKWRRSIYGPMNAYVMPTLT
uniref:hypothetical protein n=1 Tax=Agathobacter sp. TaxID=2021311 RepID=UPI00405672ED